MNAAALEILADALGHTVESASSDGALLLGLAALDAQAAADAMKFGASLDDLAASLADDARRFRRDAGRLGLPLGPGYALLLETALAAV
jgi:hypothetical protein